MKLNASDPPYWISTGDIDAPRRRLLASIALLGVATLFSAGPVFAAGASAPPAMQEQAFWALIEAAKRNAGNSTDARVSALTLQLTKLDLKVIAGFQRQYDQLILRANKWSLWGGCSLMNGGCSDDSFRYFRDWLISEGRETYDRALVDPDSLVDLPRREYFDLEAFGYAAMKVFKTKGGGELERDFSGELATPAGTEWTEAELPKLFPKLAAKYSKK